MTKLTYRGITYEPTSNAFQKVQGELSGRYRGVVWSKKKHESSSEIQSIVVLKYRGLDYIKIN